MNVYIELTRDFSVLDLVSGGGANYRLSYRCLICHRTLTVESSAIIPAPDSPLHHPVTNGCAYSDRKFSPPVLNLIEVK